MGVTLPGDRDRRLTGLCQDIRTPLRASRERDEFHLDGAGARDRDDERRDAVGGPQFFDDAARVFPPEEVREDRREGRAPVERDAVDLESVIFDKNVPFDGEPLPARSGGPAGLTVEECAGPVCVAESAGPAAADDPERVERRFPLRCAPRETARDRDERANEHKRSSPHRVPRNVLSMSVSLPLQLSRLCDSGYPLYVVRYPFAVIMPRAIREPPSTDGRV